MKAVCFFAILLTCCRMPSTNTNQVSPIPSNFDFQGHRGCRGLMPENTIAAFIKAIDLGVTTLEMDVVITKDLQVVVSHEPFFNHEISTKPNGEAVTEAEEKSLNIFQMDYSAVKRYDVGLKSHPRFPDQQKVAAFKPLLSDVIDSVEAYIKSKGLKPVQYNIETKSSPTTYNVFHPEPKLFVDLLMLVVQQKHIEAKTIIQSFDTRTIQYLHQKNPSIKMAYLFEGMAGGFLEKRLEALGFTPTVYSPAYQLVNKSVIETCHAKGIKVIPWTVNKTSQMKKLIELGVDGIISDYPNLFKEIK